MKNKYILVKILQCTLDMSCVYTANIPTSYLLVKMENTQHDSQWK